jgi:acylphosphatase
MAVVRLEVCGIVQGVGFRYFAREAARRLDLAGWVRNRDDGCVEIAAEGDDGRVRQFVAQVERGPIGAHVTEVRHLPTAELAELPKPFTILR